MDRKLTTVAALLFLSAAVAATAAEITPADAAYYADFADIAKNVGKDLDRLGDLFAKANSGKSYSAECEDRASDLGDAYHKLEEKVPPADAVEAHKALMTSTESGAQASLELAGYYKDTLKKKEKLDQALATYEAAIGKYSDAMSAAPVGVGRK